ncbi:MAG TPA: hypothetical protein VEC01_12640 [Noviherbaspirillum sp.]|uniref:hypothetical protein n=1 Tax=Noviherbaspirillum sp. TaxID=1926288 RepID=UPI002D4E6445|nr:hypothetical protein [Noviherbaspirillum sp.]HYD96167.1 hypothetical protein [Noviherbaspirillum sp.]
MTTLIIQDLAIAADLDASGMASIRGGTSFKGTVPGWMPTFGGYGYGNATVTASQQIGQSQDVMNNNGNNAAFVCGITSTVNPTQTANNNISF